MDLSRFPVYLTALREIFARHGNIYRSAPIRSGDDHKVERVAR